MPARDRAMEFKLWRCSGQRYKYTELYYTLTILRGPHPFTSMIRKGDSANQRKEGQHGGRVTAIGKANLIDPRLEYWPFWFNSLIENALKLPFPSKPGIV